MTAAQINTHGTVTGLPNRATHMGQSCSTKQHTMDSPGTAAQSNTWGSPGTRARSPGTAAQSNTHGSVLGQSWDCRIHQHVLHNPKTGAAAQIETHFTTCLSLSQPTCLSLSQWHTLSQVHRQSPPSVCMCGCGCGCACVRACVCVCVCVSVYV